MIVSFSRLDLHERPSLILKNAGDTPLAVLGFATNIEFDGNYNELSTLSFDVPAIVDGEPVPYYDDVVGMRIIELPGIGNFTLITPDEKNNGIKKYKECKAYSLEYEFSYKKITVANDTYKFWDSDPYKRPNTILGMIMELMPSWHVTSVSDTIINKYRTFEVSSENLYNFIKSTLQESYGCIFDFNTLDRTVTVRDVDDDADERPVYLSMQNLIKEIEIHEDSENMVTRLDVNGADGVNIRDVNPTGTNSIINLDYYMNTKNFSQELIDKYNAWKQLCENNRAVYYARSVKYTLVTMEHGLEEAKLVDLDGELIDLDNQRAVIIQAISQGTATQAMLDQINVSYSAKQNEISAQQTKVTALETEQATLLQSMQEIVTACKFESYFTDAEKIQLDRYIRDGEITEASFVATTSAYADDGVSMSLDSKALSITGASIVRTDESSGSVYDIRGGSINIASFGEAEIISAVLSNSSNNDVVFTASLSNGTMSGHTFESGCISMSGKISNISNTDSTLSGTLTGYIYFTLNPSEYQRRSIAWDLFEYGESIAEKLSQPTYTFSIESANFLALDEFESFKNNLRMGSKITLDNDGEILKPICIGVRCNYSNLAELELKFGDSYVRSDTAFKLADILDSSVTTGKTVSAGKFNYEEFSQSGASTDIRDFMKRAVDITKNKILASRGQAISMDGAGLRLRKWENQNETSFEDEQIWMNNNSIMLTDDGWQTAKMAIGKFRDPNFDGDLWGILAPTIVGTLLAGESLVIESSKTDGSSGVSVFRVDGDGCRMYNGDISVVGEEGTVYTYTVSSGTILYAEMDDTSTELKTFTSSEDIIVTKRTYDSSNILWGYAMTTDGHIGWIKRIGNQTLKNTSIGSNHIIMHPDVGIVVGKYPATVNDEAGNHKVNVDNAKLWIDPIGNIYLTGAVNATSLHIKGEDVTNMGTKITQLDTDYSGFKVSVNNRLTSAEQKITDSAIISTVVGSADGQAAIGSLIEQKADRIRMKAEQLVWDANNSSMDANGTLTIARAVMNGALSTIINNGGVRDGMIIGGGQIVAMKGGSNKFNITMPYVGSSVPVIDSYIDDNGEVVSDDVEPVVPVTPTHSWDDVAPYTGNAVSIATASGSGYGLKIGVNGQTSLLIAPNGNMWIYPTNLYISGDKTASGDYLIGIVRMYYRNGMITDIQREDGMTGFSGNIPIITDLNVEYDLETGYVTDVYWSYKDIEVYNGVITSFT